MKATSLPNGQAGERAARGALGQVRPGWQVGALKEKLKLILQDQARAKVENPAAGNTQGENEAREADKRGPVRRRDGADGARGARGATENARAPSERRDWRGSRQPHFRPARQESRPSRLESSFSRGRPASSLLSKWGSANASSRVWGAGRRVTSALTTAERATTSSRGCRMTLQSHAPCVTPLAQAAGAAQATRAGPPVYSAKNTGSCRPSRARLLIE